MPLAIAKQLEAPHGHNSQQRPKSKPYHNDVEPCSPYRHVPFRIAKRLVAEGLETDIFLRYPTYGHARPYRQVIILDL